MVLSWIYSLGEKSQVAEGDKLPRGPEDMPPPPPKVFCHEYALRYNLVHFETQF